MTIYAESKIDASTKSRVEEFEEDLRITLGSDTITANPAILEKYARDDSFSPFLVPALVVWPNSTKDVQKIIQLAIKYGIPLIPVSSSSKFRQHGDTVPVVIGSVIVDLSMMNKIVRVDKANRVVMVEAGVTFGQLIPELDKQGLRLLHPLCPRSNKSVLASALEREPTLIPQYHWDASDPLLCTEVVFGTGDMFRTGSAAGPGSIEEQLASGQAQKNPLGPTQFNLFQTIQGAQGSLGVVTWATLKCEFKPTMQKFLFVQGSDLQNLIPITSEVLKKRWGDDVFLINHRSLAALTAPENAQLQNHAKEIKEWNLVVNLTGRGNFAADKIAYLEADLQDRAKDLSAQIDTQITGVDNERLLSAIQSTCEKPWSYRYKGACQSVFCITTLDKIAPLAKLITQYNTPEKTGGLVECGFYIQPLVQGCNFHFEVQLYYDPLNPDAVPAVKSSFSHITQLLMEHGGFFSRPYGSWANDMFSRVVPENVQVLKKVKDIFDPSHVLKPGALCFTKETE